MNGFIPLTFFGAGLQYPKLWTQYKKQRRFCWCTMAPGMTKSRSSRRWNPIYWTCHPSLRGCQCRVLRGLWPTGEELVEDELKRFCCHWAVTRKHRTFLTVTRLVFEGWGVLGKHCSWRDAHLCWWMFLEIVNCLPVKAPSSQKSPKTSIWRA